MTDVRIQAQNLSKQFILHQQNGVQLDVLQQLNFTAKSGECLIFSGRSGSGKSTLLKMIYGNYLATGGSLQVKQGDTWVEMVGADPRSVVQLRRHTIGYVSQFLKTIPRVSTLNVVMEPALERGWSEDAARKRAEDLLSRLNIPSRLWALAPSTFSGGEQQRVNIARGFMVDWDVLLLDEPTASLDETNRQVVVDLMQEAKAKGAAMVGIFHDQTVRQAIGDKQFNVSANEVSSHVQ
ncbi:phosphonate C-P lyase system protein PhnL [Vitreoscilla sp. C1]|uniref:phosphonate C-P lyase system protein PhnL n=1 Tax=Vitreoscilla sp. (strain C1) TaxID=96942 RepID=UPI000CDC48C2|nr:phosphonate C-P lyase system protein PhnL [Vitreoscilla sp. C1]AUZ04825.1 phosphonate C-P lyase system protein PhnL [Vitreoscilla sp. C1]